MDPAVQKIFREYEKAFNVLDFDRQAEMFAEHFISAGPKGSIAQGREEFLKLSHQAADFYRSIGHTSAKIIDIREIEISHEYSMVPIHWASTFKKTGNKPIEFNVTYFVQKTDPANPKIIMFITHEDEEAAMKQLGVTAA